MNIFESISKAVIKNRSQEKVKGKVMIKWITSVQELMNLMLQKKTSSCGNTGNWTKNRYWKEMQNIYTDNQANEDNLEEQAIFNKSVIERLPTSKATTNSSCQMYFKV